MSRPSFAWLYAAMLGAFLCMEAVEDDNAVSAVLYGIAALLAVVTSVLASRIDRGADQ